jgi:UDP-glucose 4-epimerase
MNRVLVTGGAGFIGSHTVDLLLQQNKQVIVLDNLSSGKLDNLNLQHPNLEFIEGDILEFPFVLDLVNQVDAVLHLAAIASVPLSVEQPIYTFQVNAQGFLHVLEAIWQSDSAKRLVYASSAAVYGDATQLPCSDVAPITNTLLSPYALQKYNNEQYAALYAHLHGIKSLGLRYFNAYGDRQDPASPYSGVISRFIQAYQDKSMITVFGDGKQSRDFIHVSDIANANVLALSGEVSGVMNIATGTPETLLQMIAYLNEIGGYAAEVNFAPERKGDIKASYADVATAREKLQFSAKIKLKEGLARLLVV